MPSQKKGSYENFFKCIAGGLFWCRFIALWGKHYKLEVLGRVYTCYHHSAVKSGGKH